MQPVNSTTNTQQRQILGQRSQNNQKVNLSHLFKKKNQAQTNPTASNQKENSAGEQKRGRLPYTVVAGHRTGTPHPYAKRDSE